MHNTAEEIGLGRRLAQRLYPLTLGIGLLISVGLPATYYVLESNALKRTAALYAGNLSDRLRDLVLEAPALWKYQTYRYGQSLRDFLPRKDVTVIRILDEAGRPISGYEHTTAKAEAWWNFYAPLGSAPILFNNRQVGTVQVALSQGALLGVTLALLLLSTTMGVGLAVLVYVFPVTVVTRMEEESERLRAAAQASEERFRDLVQELDAIVWEADAETFQFSFVSRRAEQIQGYPVEQWLTEPGFWANHLHPDDSEWAVAYCQKATAEGRDHHFEYRALAADGRVIWLSDIVRVVRDDSGRTRQLRGVMVDITDRKRSEQRQATQFAVTRILAESATVGQVATDLLRAICQGVAWDLGELWRVDAAGHLLRRESAWHSPSLPLEEFEEISRGLTFSRGVGLPGIVWDTGQPLWRTDVVIDPKFPRMQAAARAGLHAACGFPIRTGGRVTGVMVFFSRMLRESDEDLLTMMDDLGSQIGQFIERKKAEQALARRTRELEGLHEIAQAFATMTDPRETYGRLARLVAELVGATKCVIGIYDPKERTMVSQAPGYGITDELVTAFCYPVDEVRSAWNFRLHGPLLANDPALIPPFFKRFIEAFGIKSLVVVPLRIEGRITGLIYAMNKPGGFSEDDVKPLSVFAGQAAVVIENTRLFAESEAQTRELEAKNQELEAFVYTVTHDLRAPLVALQGMAGMLAETKGAQLDAEGQHYLNRLVRNTTHMEELIRDLLEFSRVGRLPKPPEAVAVAEVVDEILLQRAEEMREKGIKVSCRDLPVLWGERTRVEQVFSNLIGNALKFFGADNPTPMVEVGAEDREQAWECYVKDNGIGIAPAYHGKVFELFQRLREVEAEGTGVGLAIVKKIVELAGGKIWIESDAGKGATFRFTWPKVSGEGNR